MIQRAWLLRGSPTNNEVAQMVKLGDRRIDTLNQVKALLNLSA